ncbi:MAG: hypothetical protein AAFZ04_00570 [Pseudomonadota bacterium]
MEWVDVKLKSELADAARMLAQERGVTVSQLLRDLVTREIKMTHRARPAETAQDHMVQALRDRLLPEFTQAKSWSNLTARLKSKGYCLVVAGGGLALHSRDSGRRVCKASDLGFAYRELIKQMGEAFPGHPHAWLAQRVLSKPTIPGLDDKRKEGTHRRPPVKDITEDFDVIEPF